MSERERLEADYRKLLNKKHRLEEKMEDLKEEIRILDAELTSIKRKLNK